VSGLASFSVERSLDAVRACAVGGLPRDPSAIADALGLLPDQFGATRHGAIQADIDLPAGFWRVWPGRGVGLWVGRDPLQMPPLQHWQPTAEIDLLDLILTLGSHGVWLYEAQLRSEGEWGDHVPLKRVYEELQRGPQRYDAVRGAFGEPTGRSLNATILRSGCVEAVSPTQAVRWLSLAYDLTSD
jgi:hypothetical protein